MIPASTKIGQTTMCIMVNHTFLSHHICLTLMTDNLRENWICRVFFSSTRCVGPVCTLGIICIQTMYCKILNFALHSSLVPLENPNCKDFFPINHVFDIFHVAFQLPMKPIKRQAL